MLVTHRKSVAPAHKLAVTSYAAISWFALTLNSWGCGSEPESRVQERHAMVIGAENAAAIDAIENDVTRKLSYLEVCTRRSVATKCSHSRLHEELLSLEAKPEANQEALRERLISLRDFINLGHLRKLLGDEPQ